MSAMEQIPEKPHYRVTEVCQYTDTQPYVLRFWESEFPQLSPDKSRGGQSMYRKEDIELILRIKKLLYEHDYTIPGARKALEDGYNEEVTPADIDSAVPAEPVDSVEAREPSAPRIVRTPVVEARERAELQAPDPQPIAAAPATVRAVEDSVSRRRYEDAVDEIEELRLQVQEAKAQLKKAEARVGRSLEEQESLEARRRRAATALRDLIDRLS